MSEGDSKLAFRLPKAALSTEKLNSAVDRAAAVMLNLMAMNAANPLVSRNQKPETRNQEPGTRNQEPGTRNQEQPLTSRQVRQQDQNEGRNTEEMDAFSDSHVFCFTGCLNKLAF